MSREIELKFSGDASELLSTLGALRGATGGWGQSLTGLLQPIAGAEAGVMGLGGAMLGGVAVVAAGIAVAVQFGQVLNGIATEWNDVRDTIVAGTGESAAAVQAMADQVGDLGERTPASLGKIADAVTQMKQRLGEVNEDLAHNMLEVARMQGGDSSTLVKNITSDMVQWKVATADQTDVLDQLFVASQRSGVPVEQLSEKVGFLGPQLRMMGIELSEAIGLFAAFGKAGVNTEGLGEAMANVLTRQKAFIDQLASAQENEAQARARAGEVAQSVARNNAEAARSLAQAQEDAAERVAEADERIAEARVRAAESIEQAQERITKAIEDQERAQRSAQRALEDADDSMQDATRRKQEAEQKLKDVQASGKTEQIASARKAVADATEDVQDAEKRKRRAQEDVADRLSDAADRVREAQEAADRAVIKGQQDIAEAAAEAGKTRADAARMVETAERRVADQRAAGSRQMAETSARLEDMVAKTEKAQARVNTVGTSTEKVWDTIIDSIKNAPPEMGKIIAIEAFGSEVGPRIAEVIQNGLVDADQIVKMTQDHRGAVQQASDATTHLGERWDMFVNTAKNTEWVKTWANDFQNGLSGVVDGLSALVSDPWGSVKYLLLESPFSVYGIGKMVVDAFAWVMNAIGGVAGNVMNGIGDTIYRMWSAIPEVGKNFLNGLITIWNSVAGMFKIDMDVPEWIPGIGGRSLHLDPVPKISYLAEGGVITGPTNAVLGEYSGAYRDPEIASPQSIMRQTLRDALAEAFKEMPRPESGGNGQPIYLTIDGQVFAKIIGDILRTQELSIR